MSLNGITGLSVGKDVGAEVGVTKGPGTCGRAA